MNPRDLRAARRFTLSAGFLAALALPRLAAAQTSPFLTGATALETNIIAWLTPIAIILVMVLGAMAMANRIERLITIEDARELVLDRHPNHVRLFYSKDDQGRARVTPKQLLESCLRMRPDRVLLAELRSEEAFDYLRNVNSGHPGSITSVHAASAELAFEQLVLLVKQSRAGAELARRDIKSLLYMLVDVVIQFGVENHERFIKEIWYEPQRKRASTAR